MQKTTRRFGALSSSVDPEKLSTTVTGAIVSISSILVFVASHFLGVAITDSQVVQSASQIGEAAGSIMVLFGLLRKIIIAVHDRFFPQG